MTTAGNFSLKDRGTDDSNIGKEISAAITLLRDIMLIKENDRVAITCDEFSDDRVANVLMITLKKLGAEPIVVKYPAESFKEGRLPGWVSELIYSADVWLELSEKYALYSETRFNATNLGVRYSCLTGMDSDLLIRAFSDIDYSELLRFGETLRSAVSGSEDLEIVTGGGEAHLRAHGKVESSVVAGKPNATRGSTTMLAGTVNWISPESKITGDLLVDGSIWPPIGILKEPVKLSIEGGVIKRISGGLEATTLAAWLEDLKDENMYRIAHFTIGYHPRIKKLRGKVLEDERLFGSFQIGFGTQGPAFGKKWVAKAHSDAITTRPTVKLSGKPILMDGKFVLENFSQSSFTFCE
jgi:leucyl aminopeptidase (aminopeptidase T)